MVDSCSFPNIQFGNVNRWIWIGPKVSHLQRICRFFLQYSIYGSLHNFTILSLASNLTVKRVQYLTFYSYSNMKARRTQALVSHFSSSFSSNLSWVSFITSLTKDNKLKDFWDTYTFGMAGHCLY